MPRDNRSDLENGLARWKKQEIRVDDYFLTWLFSTLRQWIEHDGEKKYYSTIYVYSDLLLHPCLDRKDAEIKMDRLGEILGSGKIDGAVIDEIHEEIGHEKMLVEIEVFRNAKNLSETFAKVFADKANFFGQWVRLILKKEICYRGWRQKGSRFVFGNETIELSDDCDLIFWFDSDVGEPCKIYFELRSSKTHCPIRKVEFPFLYRR